MWILGLKGLTEEGLNTEGLGLLNLVECQWQGLECI